MAPPPKKSKRQQTHKDKVKPHEFYPAPADDKMDAFAGEGEEQPGLLVGCSYGRVGAEGWAIDTPNMPQLSMEESKDTNYAWWPLARRG